MCGHVFVCMCMCGGDVGMYMWGELIGTSARDVNVRQCVKGLHVWSCLCVCGGDVSV